MAILTDLSAIGSITDRLSVYMFYLVDTGQHAQLLTNVAIITYVVSYVHMHSYI